MRVAPLLALTLVLVLPSAARAERFRYRFRPGQVIDVRANLAGASLVGPTVGTKMKMQFRVSMRQTQRVRSISGGVVTLDVTDTPLSGKMMSGGKTEPMPKAPTRTVVRLSERGRFLSRKNVGSGDAAETGTGIDGADALFGLNFPDRDLKPGDTWQDTLQVGTATPQRVRGTWKYLGRELFQGRDCARISTVLTVLTSGGSAAATGFPESGAVTASMITYFDPKEGVEVYSSGFLTLTSKADLSAISPDAGELASVTKINTIQWLVPTPRKGARNRSL